jgi:hypothetical protein
MDANHFHVVGTRFFVPEAVVQPGTIGRSKLSLSGCVSFCPSSGCNMGQSGCPGTFFTATEVTMPFPVPVAVPLKVVLNQ